MNPASGLRPYGDLEPDRADSSPHLSDYWQVVSRRLWLVLLVFGVTTASAIWAVSRQQIYYRAHVSLQVNDPAQPARGLVTPGRISGIDIFVDPIESEIQVLRSSPIAQAVADSLGLRFRPSSGDLVRSDLFSYVRLASDAPEGHYELAYDPAGGGAALRTAHGEVLGRAPIGQRVETAFVLPSGPFPPNPSELLNSKAMQRLLDEFEGRYSMVIVDSPPVLAVTDGAVVVLRSGDTEQRAAERSVEQLRRLGLRVFGAVLNEVSTTTTEESYYLQYSYAYQPQDAEREPGWSRFRRGLSRARFW